MQMQYVGTRSAVEAVLEQGFRRAFDAPAGVPLQRPGLTGGFPDGHAAIVLDIPDADLPPADRFSIPAGIADRYPVVAYRGVEVRIPHRVSPKTAQRRGGVAVVAAAALLGIVASAAALPFGRGEGRKHRALRADDPPPPPGLDSPTKERRKARPKRRAPRRARPSVVQRVIAAANQIAAAPYRYGGGHGSFADSGYDCSGSVSYALHGGGLLAAPLDSSGFMGYGEPGPGRHITIYANPGHVYMTVGGRRFDTSARAQAGSRWSTAARSSAAYVLRHPPGL